MSDYTSIPTTLEYVQGAHAGQKYGKLPYWHHSVEVMLEAQRLYYSHSLHVHLDKDTVMKAALLHDVLEDTCATYADIGAIFGDNVANAVVLLTRDADTEYLDYVQNIIDSGNRVAMLVKLADNYANYNSDKSAMSAKRANKLQARYASSIKILIRELES